MIKSSSAPLVALLLLSACFTSSKPVAHLEFSSIHQSEGRYAITFYSDKDIDGLFIPKNGEKIVSRSLICALGNDLDFRVEHNLEKLFDGDLVLEKKEKAQRYKYVSNGNFFRSWDKDTYRRTIDSKEVVRLIRDKQDVDCKIVVTVYLHQPYYSATMKIPVVELLRVLTQAHPAKPCCNVPDAPRENSI